MELDDFEIGELLLVSWLDPTSSTGRLGKKQKLARWRSVGWVVSKGTDVIDHVVLSAHRVTPTDKEHFEEPLFLPVALITDALLITEP